MSYYKLENNYIDDYTTDKFIVYKHPRQTYIYTMLIRDHDERLYLHHIEYLM